MVGRVHAPLLRQQRLAGERVFKHGRRLRISEHCIPVRTYVRQVQATVDLTRADVVDDGRVGPEVEVVFDPGHHPEREAALTADGSEAAKETKRCGANAVFAKPMNFDELLAQFARMLAPRGAQNR